jgi:hypothetical protein
VEPFDMAEFPGILELFEAVGFGIVGWLDVVVEYCTWPFKNFEHLRAEGLEEANITKQF